jgi:hypothetical protein
MRLGNKEGRTGRNKHREKNKKGAQKGRWEGKKGERNYIRKQKRLDGKKYKQNQKIKT